MNNKVKYPLVLALPLLYMSQIAAASCEDAEVEGVECVVVIGDENDNVDQSSSGGGFVYTDGGSQQSDSANNSNGNGGGSSSDSEQEPRELKEQCKLMIQADYTRCNRLASEKYETNLKQNCGDKKSSTIGITTPIFSFTLTDEAYEKCEKEVLSTSTKDYRVCDEGKADGDLQCFLMQP